MAQDRTASSGRRLFLWGKTKPHYLSQNNYFIPIIIQDHLEPYTHFFSLPPLQHHRHTEGHKGSLIIYPALLAGCFFRPLRLAYTILLHSRRFWDSVHLNRKRYPRMVPMATLATIVHLLRRFFFCDVDDMTLY
jgi:hypothetical protein